YEIRFILDNVVRQKSVCAFDAAFGIVAGHAEIWPSATACAALGVWTRPADHRYGQVPGLKAAHFLPNLDNLRQRLMSQNEVVGAGRRITMLERSDLPIRATKTYFTHL